MDFIIDMAVAFIIMDMVVAFIIMDIVVAFIIMATFKIKFVITHMVGFAFTGFTFY